MRNQNALLSTVIPLIFFILLSCMYVKNLDTATDGTSREINLVLNRVNNSGGTNNDRFESIIESGDYYITVGRSRSDLSGLTGGSGSQGGTDFIIAKHNKYDLSLVTINNLGGINEDYFFDVIESGGYYITTGTSRSDLSGLTGGSNTQGNFDFVIARFNKSDLSLDKINNLGGTDTEQFFKLIESENYYITIGYSLSDLSGLTGGSNTLGSNDFVIAKFNTSDLSLVNINNTGGTADDRMYDIVESDNYYIAVGTSRSDLSAFGGSSSSYFDSVIAKFNKTDLSIANVNNLGGTGTDSFTSVIESGDYYIAAGYSDSDLSGLAGGTSCEGSEDCLIAKFNTSDLTLVNLNNLGGINSDKFEKIIQSGIYYICAGNSSSSLDGLSGGVSNNGAEDFILAKFYTSDLSLKDISNTGSSSTDILRGIIESEGHYIAVGDSSSDLSGFTGGNNTNGNHDFVLAQFGN